MREIPYEVRAEANEIQYEVSIAARENPCETNIEASYQENLKTERLELSNE